MSGRKLILPDVEFDTEYTPPPYVPPDPTYDVDPIESLGSIVLVEPMHPSVQWNEGVPLTGASLPNILGDLAAPVVGSNLPAGITIVGMTGAKGKLERTGKGGLHAIYSNTEPSNISSGSNNYVIISPHNSTLSYIVDNWDHNFYISLWTNITRLAPGGGLQLNSQAQLINSTAPSANYKAFVSHTGWFGASGNPEVEGWRDDPWPESTGMTGARIVNIARSGHTGNAPASASAARSYLFTIGNGGAFNSFSTAKENSPSAVFYRAYIEDLTVSGRSYATVDDIDYRLYMKEVMQPEGRYYGDTYTDPAEIP